MKKILVPFDFSNTAMKGLTYAAQISERTGATLYLLHAIEPITDEIKQPYPLHERLQKEIDSNRLTEFKSIQNILVETYPGVKTEINLQHGMVITSILEFAKKQQVDLIVMGTTGASGMKEFFMGSVSAGTIGRAKIPILTIPHDYFMEEPDGILFLTNHYEENKDLLDPIIELASLFSATVHVVVFIDTDEAKPSDYLHNTRQLNRYIETLKKMYPGINFKGELLEGSEFEGTIEKYDSRSEVDIIAMITYPKSFWEKFMRKSRTKKMAFHTTIPLLAIPAK